MNSHRYEITIRELTETERLRKATKEVIIEEIINEVEQEDANLTANQRLDELADSALQYSSARDQPVEVPMDDVKAIEQPEVNQKQTELVFRQGLSDEYDGSEDPTNEANDNSNVLQQTLFTNYQIDETLLKQLSSEQLALLANHQQQYGYQPQQYEENYEGGEAEPGMR